jgi:hypothetical protein
MAYTGTESMAKVIVEEIRRRLNDLPTIDFGYVTSINVNTASPPVSVDYTVSVYLPDRDLMLQNVPVLSPMFGDGYGMVFLPPITTPTVGQRCIVSFCNKQLEDPCVLGFVRNIVPINDTLIGQTSSVPSTIQVNEFIIQHKNTANGKVVKFDIAPDNTVSIVVQDGAKMKLNPDGSFKLLNVNGYGIGVDASGNVTISGSTVNFTQTPIGW